VPPCRRAQCLGGVEGGGKLAAVDQVIHPLDILALGIGQYLQFLHVAPHRVDEIGEIERQQPRVGHPQRCPAGDLLRGPQAPSRTPC